MPRTKGQSPAPFEWKKETYSWTWPMLLHYTLNVLGGRGTPLKRIYEIIEPHPKTRGKKHWRARVRQVLEGSSNFVRVRSGVWGLSQRFHATTVEKFNRTRRKEYPLLGPREPKEDS